MTITCKLCLNKKNLKFLAEDSSSDDDEITWTCLQRSQKRTHDNFDREYIKEEVKEEEDEEERKTPARNETKPPNSNKPPRFANANSVSLDRRQRSRSQSHRRERDSKSRSTHSLKDKDLNEKILIGNSLTKDNNSSSSCSNRRMSPIAWEIPPPPPFHPWEHHYFKHHMASREDLRSMEYYRRPYDPYRLGSCQELFQHPSNLSLSGGNYDTPYYHYPPPCCSNHYYSPPYQVNGLKYNFLFRKSNICFFKFIIYSTYNSKNNMIFAYLASR